MEIPSPTLRTKRLLLRGLVDSDLDNIFKGLSNPDVVRHYGISFDTMEAAEEQMVWFADKKQLWWAICSGDDHTFYGAGGLNDIGENRQKAEIGLWLLPEYWGHGIMKEALPLIANHGFNELGLSRIEGFVETDNLNCKRAMAQLDFRHEKTLTNCEIKNGKSISLDVYVKTNRE